jgi:hypothetical protein
VVVLSRVNISTFILHSPIFLALHGIVECNQCISVIWNRKSKWNNPSQKLSRLSNRHAGKMRIEKWCFIDKMHENKVRDKSEQNSARQWKGRCPQKGKAQIKYDPLQQLKVANWKPK